MGSWWVSCQSPPSLSHPCLANGQPKNLPLSPSNIPTNQEEQNLFSLHQTKTHLQNHQPFPMKPKILCLHGFRTSASILRRQILGRWPQIVLDKLDLEFLDGPFPATGRSQVEGFFEPPYYEWYQASEDFREYANFEESMAYIEEYMLKHGPFDGGAIISAAIPRMQEQGLLFTKAPEMKFLILISGTMFGGFKYGQPRLAATAFSSPLKCHSLHFIGDKDFLKEGGSTLMKSFVDPFVIRHSKGHVIPRLDDVGVDTMLKFIEKIQP